MPGIFVQTSFRLAVSTEFGLAEDLKRDSSSDSAPSDRPFGRARADVPARTLVRNLFVVVIITVRRWVIAVGFRIGTTFAPTSAASSSSSTFAYALSWGSQSIGLPPRTAKPRKPMSFPILFPLVFASSAFVPVATMPSWLQGWAKNQPVSVVVDRGQLFDHWRAGHQQFIGTPSRGVDHRHRHGQHPFAVARYRKAT